MSDVASPPTAIKAVPDLEPPKKYVDFDDSVGLTLDERTARGKAARADAPRSSHALFEPLEHRHDPVELLQSQATSRVPELVPIRYGRMLASPFAFFRGAALIMAADLAATPRSGLNVQLCGDAHLSNFGFFASPERNLVFDVNDFDETLPGPWEWDVKRLIASVVIAGRHNGYSAADVRTCALAGAAGYRNAMNRLASATNLEVWYDRIDASELMEELRSAKLPIAKKAEKFISKAYGRDSGQAAAKLTEVVDGHRRFISDPPLLVPIRELLPDDSADFIQDMLASILDSYRGVLVSDRAHLVSQFRMVGIARKVVGVGSVGTRAWVMLLQGRDADDILLLQAKEAQRSVLEEFLAPSIYTNQGERVVAGQHLMQASSDIFLGHQRFLGLDGQERDFYIRQLRDWKASFDPALMVPSGLARYAEVCARTLARAHARSGDRVAIASYLGSGSTFDQAIATFSEAYADQNQLDYEALQSAAADGRITVQSGI